MNHLMDEKQIHRRCIPRLATELYKVMDNKEKWREEAEHLFELDVEVARDLLTEYSQTTYDDFIRIARNYGRRADLGRNWPPLCLRTSTGNSLRSSTKMC